MIYFVTTRLAAPTVGTAHLLVCDHIALLLVFTMAATDNLESVECEQCGAVMELRQEKTRKSLPIIGREVTVRNYTCPECGAGSRYKRKTGEDWTKTST